jgi:hypothetical protein
MVIERFHNRNPEPIYRRFRDRGRQMPEGLRYVGSWIERNYDRCFQLMESDDEQLLHDWTTNWNDLIDFEIVPVLTSDEIQKMMFPRL